ncbi:MAG: PfkB family carbohydrate kinase [Micrococcales bacterium]|nr:PfkB family carbohydrate kinase [Micrococcales bacterium]
MARTLVVGESLIDAVTRANGTRSEHVGGSPANVAFGLAALDHEVDLATWIGADEHGERIEAVCRSRGIALTAGSRGATRTSVAHARLDPSGTATYGFDLDWRIGPVTGLEDYGHVHTGSIASVLLPGADMVRETLRQARERATVSYDPNARPTLMGSASATRAAIEESIALSDVVKASDEDIAWLCPGEPLDQVMRTWAARGPALVVVTRGGDGALVHMSRSGDEATLPARSVTVIDTVGAGDSFMAGLLSGLLDAGLLGGAQARHRLAAASLDDVTPAVLRALATGALTVARPGAHAPHRVDLEAAHWHANCGNSTPR